MTMVTRTTGTGKTLTLIQGEGMTEQVYGKVTLRKFDLFGPFAATFAQLANDKEVNAQVKLKLLRLKKLLMEEGAKLSEIKEYYVAKGKDITEEEKKTFEAIAAEEITVDFEQIDIMLLINKLSVTDMEVLKPILKGIK